MSENRLKAGDFSSLFPTHRLKGESLIFICNIY